MSEAAPGVSIGDCSPSEVGLPAVDVSFPYVPRAVDALVRERLLAAAVRGGIVHLAGDPRTGRTRCAFEALRDVLPDWNLVTADRAGDLERLPPRTVLWLDDLEDRLAELTGDAATGPSAADLHRLVARPEPVVVVAITRAGTCRAIRAPRPDRHDGQRDDADEAPEQRRLAVTRLLALADPAVRLDGRLDAAERERAGRIAGTDPRVAAALADPEHFYARLAWTSGAALAHLDQAGPDLAAVLDAAVDCRRLGYRAPLTEELLRDAVGGDATEPLSATLERATGTVLVSVPGGLDLEPYAAFHLERTRLVTPVPERVRAAAERHATDADDLVRLARDAWDHLDEPRAERLYRRAVTVRHPGAARQLCTLLERQNRRAEALDLCRDLAAHASAGAGLDWARRKVQGRAGDAAALHPGDVETGDARATRTGFGSRLVTLLCRADRLDEAIDAYVAAGGGGGDSAELLAEYLQDSGRLEDAAGILLDALNNGDVVHRQLGTLLRRLGRYREAAKVYIYADLDGLDEELADMDDADELLAAIRQLAVDDPKESSSVDDWLADMELETRAGRVKRWRKSLDPERPGTYEGLARALGDQRRHEDVVAVWRAAVAAGVAGAHSRLADSLWTADGDEAIEVSRAAVAAGEHRALESLAFRLLHAGRGGEILTLCRVSPDGRVEAPGVSPDAMGYVHGHVAAVLYDMGRIDEAVAVYRRAIEDGAPDLFANLIALLRVTRRDDEAIDVWREEYVRRRRDAHRTAKSCDRVDLGDTHAALGSLTGLLERAGRVDEVVALWRDALVEDHDRGEIYKGFVELLRRHGRVAEVVEARRYAWVRGNPQAGADRSRKAAKDRSKAARGKSKRSG